MKTKTELQLMSDVQLISTLCELTWYTVDPYVFQGIITIRQGNKTTTFEMTYNDIMPIVEQYDISVNPCNGWAHGYLSDGNIIEAFDSTNPLRAIVMLLILIIQAGE